MVDGPNVYLYCSNDPINLVDLWGLCQKPWWEPDAGFAGRFWNQFYKDRLPVISWFSYAPLPFPSGLAIGLGIEATNRTLQNIAVREATRNFTSFSGTRNFVYMSGYQPEYFAIAGGIGRASLILGVAGTAADLGTAIESAVYTWRNDQ